MKYVPQIVHYVMGALMIVSLATSNPASTLPEWSTALTAVHHVAVVLLMVFGSLSGSIAIPGVASAAQRGFANLRILAAIAIVACALFLAPLLTHCTPAVSAAAGDAGACIIQAALEGDSVAQIATHCGVDVAAVLVALAANKDPKVQTSAAGVEAAKARLAMQGAK